MEHSSAFPLEHIATHPIEFFPREGDSLPDIHEHLCPQPLSFVTFSSIPCKSPEEMIICGSCKQIFVNPHTLSCSHRHEICGVCYNKHCQQCNKCNICEEDLGRYPFVINRPLDILTQMVVRSKVNQCQTSSSNCLLPKRPHMPVREEVTTPDVKCEDLKTFRHGDCQYMNMISVAAELVKTDMPTLSGDSAHRRKRVRFDNNNEL